FWITKKKGLPQAKAISDDATEAESIEDEQVADIEIPKFERKLKGKRQDKK
ncbi:MAG: protein translocase subunit SecF, partial [Spirochaetales bacterium]|nr:protein translocase subunit SecF [Spirochaetales bacterium]